MTTDNLLFKPLKAIPIGFEARLESRVDDYFKDFYYALYSNAGVETTRYKDYGDTANRVFDYIVANHANDTRTALYDPKRAIDLVFSYTLYLKSIQSKVNSLASEKYKPGFLRNVVIPALKHLIYRMYKDPNNVLGEFMYTVRTRDVIKQYPEALGVEFAGDDMLSNLYDLDVYDLDAVDKYLYGISGGMYYDVKTNTFKKYNSVLERYQSQIWQDSVLKFKRLFEEWCKKVTRHSSWSSQHPAFDPLLRAVFDAAGTPQWDAALVRWVAAEEGQTLRIYAELKAKVEYAQTFIDEKFSPELLKAVGEIAKIDNVKRFVFLSAPTLSPTELQAILDAFEKILKNYTEHKHRDALVWAVTHPAAHKVCEEEETRDLFNKIKSDEYLQDGSAFITSLLAHYAKFRSLEDLLREFARDLGAVRKDAVLRKRWLENDEEDIRKALIDVDWKVLYEKFERLKPHLNELRRLLLAGVGDSGDVDEKMEKLGPYYPLIARHGKCMFDEADAASLFARATSKGLYEWKVRLKSKFPKDDFDRLYRLVQERHRDYENMRKFLGDSGLLSAPPLVKLPSSVPNLKTWNDAILATMNAAPELWIEKIISQSKCNLQTLRKNVSELKSLMTTERERRDKIREWGMSGPIDRYPQTHEKDPVAFGEYEGFDKDLLDKIKAPYDIVATVEFDRIRKAHENFERHSEIVRRARSAVATLIEANKEYVKHVATWGKHRASFFRPPRRRAKA